MDDFEKEIKLETIGELFDCLSDFYDFISSKELDLDSIFRLCHNIKGTSRSAGFSNVSQLFHNVESYINFLKNGSVNEEVIDLLFDVHTEMSRYVEKLQKNINEDFDFTNLQKKLSDCMSKNGDESKAKVSESECNILIIDDDEDVAEVISMMVESILDAKIQIVENGASGIEETSKKVFDVIITDYKMPVMDGLEFVNTMRENSHLNKFTPVIFLTGFKPNFVSSDQLENTFLMEKPISEKKLRFILRCCHNLKVAS